MNIQARKEALIEWVRSLDDLTILSQLEEIVKSQSPDDWWDNLPQRVQEDIWEGNKDIKEGRVISHEEALATVRRRLGISHDL